MHRHSLLTLLRRHHPADAREQAMTQATLDFVTRHPACFERLLIVGESKPGESTPGQSTRGQSRPGHVTGSAWIVSPDRQWTLLIHHRKLNRWFQPGGHADGDPDVAAVARREAEEETGLASLKLVGRPDEPAAIFDVDIHPIPARGDTPEHLHYDIRFLLEADPDEPFGDSDEITNIRWVLLENVLNYTDSESILRMVRKIQGKL